MPLPSPDDLWSYVQAAQSQIAALTAQVTDIDARVTTLTSAQTAGQDTDDTTDDGSTT